MPNNSSITSGVARKSLIVLFMVATANCSSNEYSAIQSSNDLHCAAVLLHIENNLKSAHAPRNQVGAVYASRTWYFNKLSKAEIATSANVAELLKRAPSDIAPAGRECAERALKDPKYSDWQSFAINEYIQDPAN